MTTELDGRIADLERRIRKWQLISLLVGALALVSLAITLARWTSGEVRAHAFSVVNENGEVVARLGGNKQGEPVLKLHVPSNGGEVLVGSLGEDLAGLVVFSGSDEVLVNASTDKEGNPSLSLQDKDQKAILGVRGNAPPALLMMGNAGTLAATTKDLWLKDASRKLVFSATPQSDASAAAEAEQRSR